jgi:RNA polymerase Rpb1, domain 5
VLEGAAKRTSTAAAKLNIFTHVRCALTLCCDSHAYAGKQSVRTSKTRCSWRFLPASCCACAPRLVSCVHVMGQNRAVIFCCRSDAEEAACELHVALPIDAPKVLLLELAEAAAAAALVRTVPGISNVYVMPPATPDAPPTLQTDGLNFGAAWGLPGDVDVHGITCNDVSAVLSAYGVEAARATLVREVRAVFAVYGINVDARHLSLIADFMTHGGGYRACSRLGIVSNASPLLKMSFETSAAFLKEAALRGAGEALASAAARVALGQPVALGTGVVALHMALDASAAEA